MMAKNSVFGRLVSAAGAILLVVALLQPLPLRATGLRVIVQGAREGSAVAAVREWGGVVDSEIGIIDAVVATVSRAQIAQLESDPRVVRVVPDREVALSHRVDVSTVAQGPANVEFGKAIGAQPVWESGVLGESVTVAILDTGVDPRFPELRQVNGGRGDRFLAYYDAISDRLYEPPFLLRSPGDPNGHGTHIAGIIANSTLEKRDGEYRGVAPAANIVAVRVLNQDGAGTYADVLRGIHWVVENRDTYGIRVLNISMYAVPVAPYWADPYNLAVMEAWKAGIVVVASAGNTGPEPMTVGVPGNTPYVITVGAFTDNRTPSDFGDDYIPEFSAAGPTLDAFVKPDVIAPGAHVVSLMHQTATIRRDNPERAVGGRYFEMSGSSMSTAVISGIAALMVSEHGELTPDEVKYRVTQTARPQVAEVDGAMAAAYSVWQQGAGRVWAEDAVLSDVTGAANQGMDIADDLRFGGQHYQGWTTFDAEEGLFKIIGGGLDGQLEGYTTWDGRFADWSDGYAAWTEGSTNWADSFDSWADSFDSWADSFDSWADSFDSWADAFGDWTEGLSTEWADLCLTDGVSLEDFALNDQSFDSWADYVLRSGSFDSWADFVLWAESFDSWADSFDSWADSFDSWADEYADDSDPCAAWQGSFDSWADSYLAWVGSLVAMTDGISALTGAADVWSGGYATWGASFDSWADSFDSWADGYSYWVSVCSVDGASFDSWADSFDSWADFVEFVNLVNSFDSWADFVDFAAWVDDNFDSWAAFLASVNSADSFDSWADSFDSWADSFDSWADSFDSWADFTTWVGSFDSWADSFDSWADSTFSWAAFVSLVAELNSFDSWADSFDSWADYVAWHDSFDSWADSFDSWADFVAWAGSFDSWADSFDSWADGLVTWAAATAPPTRPVFCDSWIESFDSWADSFDSWADSFDSWADGDPTLFTTSFEAWDNGYTRWIEDVDTDSASFDSWADLYTRQDWAQSYLSMDEVPEDTKVSINLWVEVD